MSTKLDWLRERQKGIGGSDVGAIMGVNKYKSPFQVYIEKTEPITEENEMSEVAYWGTELEDLVAREFAKRTGKKVRKDNKHLIHKDYPFMVANIDRRVVGENAILECKTANQYKIGEWENDDIPASYLLQVQHYLAVTGAKKGYIAVLVGGQKFIYKEIERDEELIEIIINAEKEFWEMVQAKTPPALDGSSAAEKYLNDRYNRATEGTQIELTSEYVENIKELQRTKKLIKDLEEQSKDIENNIKAYLGENESALAGEFIVNWKNYSRSSIDSKKLKADDPNLYEKYIKTSSYRKFEIKECK